MFGDPGKLGDAVGVFETDSHAMGRWSAMQNQPEGIVTPDPQLAQVDRRSVKDLAQWIGQYGFGDFQIAPHKPLLSEPRRTNVS